ncbi:hypothetical protein [Caldalkalibacillus salinus]|nr:hypothetical protein [Caldalkalibacillus salinus]
MDEFFRRRSKSKGFTLFMVFVLILGLFIIAAGFWFLISGPEVAI